MTAGPPSAPRIALTETFRLAIRSAMANGRRQWMLAAIAGFPSAGDLSALLYSPAFAGTRQTRSRFQKVAETIGYTGELFVEVSR